MAWLSRAAVSVAVLVVLIVVQGLSCSDATGHAGKGRKIVVGGKEQWRFGYNYSAWAMKAGPFYVGDSLTFMYKPSVFNGITVNHNVYLLHSAKAYEHCAFGKSVMLANTSQGDPGFEYTLTQRKTPLYFACAIAEGIHCNEGLMKFYIKPL